MNDVKNVIRGLEDTMKAIRMLNRYVPYSYSDQACAEAILLLEGSLPKILTLEAVKGIGTRESRRVESADVEPVWLERLEDDLSNLSMVLVSWWYCDFMDQSEDEFDFIVKYFGTDFDDTLDYNSYGKTWRIWNNKPTEEQRKAAEWSVL